MAKLNIPERYRTGIKAIREISESDVEAIATALKGVASSATTPEIVKKVASHVSGVTSPTIEKIVKTIVALSVVRMNAEVAIEEFVGDLREAVITEEIHDGSSDDFERRFKLLLNNDQLAVLAKGKSLRIEFENTFCDAKILTDVRPVFGITPQVIPAAVVTHLLKVEFHRDSRHRNFYVALDSADIDILIAALERAKLKEESISLLLKKAEVEHLNI